MRETKTLVFGDGNVLVAPFTQGNNEGIGFTTRLGIGKVGQEHPTIRKGDNLDLTDYDVVFIFKNRESIKVLQWAVENVLKDND